MLPKNITFYVKDASLLPYTTTDRELFLERYGDGEIVETETPILQKKFFAILSRVLKERPSLPWDSTEELADALKRASGATYACETLAGKPYMATFSVAAIKDFPVFFETAMRKLAEYLGTDYDDLVRDPRKEELQDKGLVKSRDEKPPAEPWPYSFEGCMRKFLELAQNRDFPATDDNRRRLEELVDAWRDYVGPWAEKCGQTCWDIMSRHLSHASGKRLLEAQIPNSIEEQYEHPLKA